MLCKPKKTFLLYNTKKIGLLIGDASQVKFELFCDKQVSLPRFEDMLLGLRKAAGLRVHLAQR